MPNIHNHDMIQRVEPSSRFQAEVQNKPLDDAYMLEVQEEKVKEQKKNQIQNSQASSELNTDGKNQDQPGTKSFKKNKSDILKVNPPKPVYLGGQLFDGQG